MDQNPYSPPQADQHARSSRDERLLRRMVANLKMWRSRPPTFGRLLFSRRSAVLFAGFSVIGAASIICNSAIGVPPEWSCLTVGMLIGIIIAHFAFIRRIAVSWPIQEPLMDWGKIDELARDLGV